MESGKVPDWNKAVKTIPVKETKAELCKHNEPVFKNQSRRRSPVGPMMARTLFGLALPLTSWSTCLRVSLQPTLVFIS